MLLEAYFMQIDNTYNKLQTLCEYIDDTEVGVISNSTSLAVCISPRKPFRSTCFVSPVLQDYINIEMDSKRNQLIRVSDSARRP